MISYLCADRKLAQECDVVVIGGGVIGASAALFLSLQGHRVTLCEKGRLAGEQSGRNQGWVRTAERDPAEIPLAIKGDELWSRINSLVGQDVGYRKSGIAFFAYNEKEEGQSLAWLDKARDFEHGARMLSRDELRKLFPDLSSYPRGALYSPNDGRAEPDLVTPAIAAAAQKAGGRVLENCAVLDLDQTAGRVSGVVTEHGTIRCGSVLLAGGAWSSLFLRRFGVRLPQLRILSTVMSVSGVVNGPETSLLADKFIMRKRMDGGYTLAHLNNHAVDIVPDSFRFMSAFLPLLRRRWGQVPLRFNRQFLEELSYTGRAIANSHGPFQRHRALMPHPRTAKNLEALEGARSLLPGFETARVDKQWAGIVDITPDELPVIASVDKLPGLVVATGFSGHGFGIGPSAGKVAAQLTLGQNTDVDISPFRLDRFQ